MQTMLHAGRCIAHKSAASGRSYDNSRGPQGQRPISLALDTLKYIPETAYLNACMLAVPKNEVTLQEIPTETNDNPRNPHMHDEDNT